MTEVATPKVTKRHCSTRFPLTRGANCGTSTRRGSVCGCGVENRRHRVRDLTRPPSPSRISQTGPRINPIFRVKVVRPQAGALCLW